MESRTVCFTGRRPKDLLGYYDKAGYEKIKNKTKELLRNLIEKDGFNRFISGGAQGFDQIAFFAVDELKTEFPDIKNILYLPCQNQDKRWMENGLFGKSDYKQMLQKADEIVYIHDRDYQYPTDMLDRNHAMVDASSLVIALYPDNTYTTNKGGTSECMRYAEAQDKEISQIAYGNDIRKYFGISGKQKNFEIG